MKSLSVCNANIISLKIDANLPILVLMNAQKLIDVCVHGFRNLDIVSQISSCLSKLDVLCLDVLGGDTQLGAKLAEVPELTRLKKLTIRVIDGSPRWSALRLASLVRFTPNLEKFEIKFQYDILFEEAKFRKK